ncbi:MAG: hypothetical protein AAF211_25680, partial [Myxococcota bacterium]
RRTTTGSLKMRTIKPTHETVPPPRTGGSAFGSIEPRRSHDLHYRRPSLTDSETTESFYVFSMSIAISLGLVIGAFLGMLYLFL